MKRILPLMITISIMILSSCSHRKSTPSADLAKFASQEQKIEDVIKGYFDKREWRYRMYTDEDSVITFRLGFTGDNENLTIHVNVFHDEAMYQIICQSETKLSHDDINSGIIAMNEYNLTARIVSGCITDVGNIVFWLGRNIDGNTFSEQAFAVDFNMVICETDDETAQIYKRALNPKKL